MKWLEDIRTRAALSHSSFSLDIGSAGLRAVSIVRRGRRIIATGARETVFPREAAGPPPPEQVKAALRDILRGKKIRQEAVVTSLPVHQAFVRSLVLPFGDLGQIRQVIASEAELHVPFPMDKIVIDFWPVEELPGGKTRVIMAAVKKDLLAARLALLGEFGLDPSAVGLDCLGLVNAFQITGLVDPGEVTLVLEAGAVHTAVSILHQNRLRYLRSFAWGGDTVTAAVMREAACGFAEAERLKLASGREGAEEPVVKKALEAAFSPLESELLRTIHSASGDTGGVMPQRIVFAGGALAQPELREFVARKVGCPVQEADPWRTIDVRKVSARPSRVSLPALGLCLGMVKPVRQAVDFRRLEFAFQGSWKSIKKRLWLTAALGGGLVAMAGFFFFSRITLEERWRNDLDQQIRMVLKRNFPDLGQIPPGSELEEMGKEADRVREEYKTYQKFSSISALDVLCEISRAVPPGIPVQVIELDINQERLQFVGRTDSPASASRIRTAIAALPLFQADKIRPGEVKKKMKEGKVVTIEFSFVVPFRPLLANGEP